MVAHGKKLQDKMDKLLSTVSHLSLRYPETEQKASTFPVTWIALPLTEV